MCMCLKHFVIELVISLFIKNNLNFIIKNDLNFKSNMCENLWVEFLSMQNKNLELFIISLVIYRTISNFQIHFSFIFYTTLVHLISITASAETLT